MSIIGVTVKQTKASVYGENSEGDYFFEGSMTELIEYIEQFKKDRGEWYGTAIELSNIRLLPEDFLLCNLAEGVSGPSRNLKEMT